MIKLLNYPKAEFSFMEVIIYLFRRFFADTADFFNIFDTGLRNFLHRTEIIQQISFPLGADSFHLVQTRFGNRLGTYLTMRSDSKTVRFVTQILQIKRYRRLKRQGKTFFAQLIIKFFAGIALRPLGNGDDRNPRQIKIF